MARARGFIRKKTNESLRRGAVLERARADAYLNNRQAVQAFVRTELAHHRLKPQVNQLEKETEALIGERKNRNRTKRKEFIEHGLLTVRGKCIRLCAQFETALSEAATVTEYLKTLKTARQFSKNLRSIETRNQNRTAEFNIRIEKLENLVARIDRIMNVS